MVGIDDSVSWRPWRLQLSIGGFAERIIEFAGGDFDIRDMQAGLCEFGAGEDETQVSVRRDGAFRVSLGKEAVFAALDMISEASSE